MSKTTKPQTTRYYLNGKDVAGELFRYLNQCNFPKSDISRTNVSNIKAETMEYKNMINNMIERILDLI